jgi:myo-inositol 2-dehydrogenase / D-chiro-inositol 1-dehydrogenase
VNGMRPEPRPELVERSELRIAVLGVGLMGSFHVDALTRRVRGSRVVVVNDFLPDKAAAVAESVGARAVADQRWTRC